MRRGRTALYGQPTEKTDRRVIQKKSTGKREGESMSARGERGRDRMATNTGEARNWKEGVRESRFRDT